uniref:Uncharacterized protein n=1 Tax=Acrobeloides nanus TaxID=290746 RepID=A0A914CNC1_9BILA
MRQRVRYNNKRVRDSRVSNLESPPERKTSKLDLISPTANKKIFDSSDDEEKPGTSTSFANTNETPGPSSSGKGTDSRKKFYIVQNGDRSEKYITDFLHRLKHDDSDSEDEPVFVKMTDRWREEWNQGVQMPLYDSVPHYIFKNEDCRNRPPVKKIPYKRTSKLVSQVDNRYVSSNSHVKVPRVPIYHYLITDEDEAWLNVINAHKASEKLPPISNENLLKVMDSLEIDAYKGIHDGLLEQLCSPCKGEIDDDTACDVCRSPECEQDDPIVFCDGCNVGVHQSCYGILQLPEGEWLCKACTLCYGQSPSCIFCPNRLGALKCTKSGKEWGHVACALWLPEVRFGDVDLREPISHVSDIPEQRWQLKCSVCDTRQGACIQCSIKNCTVAFHVSCAQRSGFKMRIENDETEKIGVRMVSYCKKHSQDEISLQKDSKNQEKGTGIQRDLTELETDFYHYVSCEEISKRLNITPLIVNDIYAYWKIKRALNENKPLMQEPIDMKIIPDWSKELPVPVAKSIKIDVDVPSLQPRYIGSGVLQRNYEKSRRVRMNLEKARNLSYMIMKREKIKRDELDAEEDIFERIAKNLNDNSTPVSSRTLARLGDAWNSISLNGKNESPKIEPSDKLLSTNHTSPMDLNGKKSIVSPKKVVDMLEKPSSQTDFNVPDSIHAQSPKKYQRQDVSMKRMLEKHETTSPLVPKSNRLPPKKVDIYEKMETQPRGRLSNSFEFPSRRLTNSFKPDELANNSQKNNKRAKIENDFLSSDESDFRSSRSNTISSKASEENHEVLDTIHRLRSNKGYTNGFEKITEDLPNGYRKQKNDQRFSEIQQVPLKKVGTKWVPQAKDKRLSEPKPMPLKKTTKFNVTSPILRSRH